MSQSCPEGSLGFHLVCEAALAAEVDNLRLVSKADFLHQVFKGDTPT